MEKNTAAGRTPSSVPLATPPPAALNASSPEFAPLSPVHSNSLNDAKSLNVKSETANFSLPPSYAEENRTAAISTRGLSAENTLGDQRSERFTGGGITITSLFSTSQFCILFIL